MNHKMIKHSNIKIIDFIPAISGLIGKVALVTSFAFVWAQELNITTPNFVFDNVRIEVIIGSIITLLVALFLPNTSPAGTLAPLIVLIPSMVSFGVHPFILSIMVGCIGIIVVKTKIFNKLILLSNHIGRSSLALTFGISGIILSAQKLLSFFGNQYIALIFLIFLLILTYVLLLRYNKSWLIIPAATIVSIVIPLLFGISMDISVPDTTLSFNPIYWWNDMWGIGFGFNIVTIIKTLPFALFVVLLWAIDTVSIKAVIHTAENSSEKNEEMNLDTSFIIVSLRNIIGGVCGGAQTSSLWRSFLIPLYMIKRPIRSSAILLGILGIIAGFTSIPIKILSFSPLIWTVLLFGIFIPFVLVGIKHLRSTQKITQKIAILLFSATGVFVSPILTWLAAVCFEKIEHKLMKLNNKID
ncbi:MAG: hypothetical protein CVU84_03550 [Firmicutes bacterium HGW-Firmicutes-1]|jgi:hypothetical protein|nr:MAG: hypothetical protein CVU84_03550 [Firmicutes bacterium HGW-Firmicutes-1]